MPDLNLTQTTALHRVWTAKPDASDDDRAVTSWLEEKIKSLGARQPVIVRSAAELQSALAAAAGGEVIEIAEGASVGPVKIAKKNFAERVVITGPGQLVNVTLDDVSNLSIQGVDLFVKAPILYGLALTNCRDILLTTNHIHGSLDQDPQNDGSGVLIVKCESVTVIGNEFEQLRRGVVANNSRLVTIVENDFHDLQTDGMMFAEMTGLFISSNFIGDFDPIEGDHPDGIQFLTKGTTLPNSDIVITNNLIRRGDIASMQGIFMGNEDKIPYKNIKITGNLLIGTGYRGISVSIGEDVDISGNELWGQATLVKGVLTGISNGIFATGITRLRLLNNAASSKPGLADLANGAPQSVDVTEGGNTITSKVTTPGQVAALITKWRSRGEFYPARLAT